MKLSRVFGVLVLLGVACIAYGATPPLNVTVSDLSGKIVFKGVTNGAGSFTTPKLKAGFYTVQFTSTSADVNGGSYALAISAGKAKVSAKAIDAGKLLGPGVAMRISLGESTAEAVKKHPELNNPAAIRAMERMEREAGASITGQVTVESKSGH